MRNDIDDDGTTVSGNQPPDGTQPAARKLTLIITRRGIWAAIRQSVFTMLRPELQRKNRVMFIVEIAAILALLCVIFTALARPHAQSLSNLISLDVWLFLTVLSTNFVNALTES